MALYEAGTPVSDVTANLDAPSGTPRSGKRIANLLRIASGTSRNYRRPKSGKIFYEKEGLFGTSFTENNVAKFTEAVSKQKASFSYMEGVKAKGASTTGFAGTCFIGVGDETKDFDLWVVFKKCRESFDPCSHPIVVSVVSNDGERDFEIPFQMGSCDGLRGKAGKFEELMLIKLSVKDSRVQFSDSKSISIVEP